MIIPFSPPYIDQETIDEVTDTLRSNWITSGPKVKALEEEITKLTASRTVVCVNSWTSGAILMLKWFGVKQGDEVIVPAYTYCATALCVMECGATPVMVDVGEDMTMDSLQLRQAISCRTKAIIPVDFAGWPCDYDAILNIIKDPEIVRDFIPETLNQEKLGRILLLSDAAHSIGAMYNGEPAAKKADVTVLSFHAVKNITTAEGGGICLNLPAPFNNDEVYAYLKIYSLNGQNKDSLAKSKSGNWKYDVLFHGKKVNMPDICAAVGLSQIRKYNSNLLPRRKAIALKYLDGFNPYAWFVAPPLDNGYRESSYHLFPLRIKGISEWERDEIITGLNDLGISVNVHFIPMPMLTLFSNLGYRIDDYPNSYDHFKCEISLPIYPQLTDVQTEYIIKSVAEQVERCLANRMSHVQKDSVSLSSF